MNNPNNPNNCSMLPHDNGAMVPDPAVSSRVRSHEEPDGDASSEIEASDTEPFTENESADAEPAVVASNNGAMPSHDSDAMVPDPAVSSSSSTAQSESAATPREWKPYNWCWLEDENEDAEEQEQEQEDDDENIDEEQEAAFPLEAHSADPIHHHANPNLERMCHSGARAPGSPRVDGEKDSESEWEDDGDKDFREDCEEDFDEDFAEDSEKDCEMDIDEDFEDDRKGRIAGSSGNNHWETMYRLLIEYKKKHGNANVPKNYAKNTQLVSWVTTQRRQYSKSKLSSGRISRLKSVGFVFDCNEANWQKMYGRLVEYKREHNGSTKVPFFYRHNVGLGRSVGLGRWVYLQQYLLKQNKIQPNRLALLQSIEFHWGPDLEKQWMDMYERLISYKKKHGTTAVPSNYAKDRELAVWVKKQRQRCKKKERVKLLNDIEFVWRPRDYNWEKMYRALVEYNKKHGDTIVPFRYAENNQLGLWVWQQRHNYSKNMLAENRVVRLESIGFVWHMQE